MAAKKENRCWPGYEPVPGKKQHSEGSCRPKAESKMTGSEKNFRSKRKRQLNNWKADHPSSPRKAAQHLSEPRKKKTAKRPAAKKTASKTKTATKTKSTAKNATRTRTRKAAAKKGA